MSELRLIDGFYVNPANVLYVKPYSGPSHSNKSTIVFAAGVELHSKMLPAMVSAQVNAGMSDNSGLSATLYNFANESEMMIALTRLADFAETRFAKERGSIT